MNESTDQLSKAEATIALMLEALQDLSEKCHIEWAVRVPATPNEDYSPHCKELVAARKALSLVPQSSLDLLADREMLDWLEKVRNGEIEPPENYPVDASNRALPLRLAITNAMKETK